MLELIILIWFGNMLARMCRQRGRSSAWVALGILFWIGGEIIGGLLGGLLGLGMGAYLLAIVVAAVGAGVSYTIIKSLPSRAMGPVV
jgi:hypothetical protein